MTDEELHAAVAKHGSIRAAARALGLVESTVRRRVRNGAKAAAKASGVRPLDEFLARHDKATIVPAKVREGLRRLDRGWMYEHEFLQLIHVTPADLGLHREAFAEHWLTTPGERKRVWFGNAADCAAMRERL